MNLQRLNRIWECLNIVQCKPCFCVYYRRWSPERRLFNFTTRFLVQNCWELWDASFYTNFRSWGQFFWKVMTKTVLPYITAGDLRSAGDPSPARSGCTHELSLQPDLVFVITFQKQFSPGPKNGLERRPPRFSTICAKNQVLKLNIDKITVILRHKSPFLVTPPVAQLCVHTWLHVRYARMVLYQVLGCYKRNCQ